jgi:hypothetical protein
MSERLEIPSGIRLELINIVLNAQSLCLAHALEHIADAEGSEAASKFKAELLGSVKHGRIDMALLEDTATYDFVVAMIDGLPVAERPAG